MGGPPKRARGSNSRTRVERDLIESLEIPRGAAYGIQTARAVANLSFSGRTLGDYPAMVRGLAMVKCAAARANLDAKAIDARTARAIEHACRALIAGGYRDDLIADPLGGGGSIGLNQNINEVIANLASEHLGGARGAESIVDPKTHVNASQSTADACATAARIAILEQASELGIALADCVRAYRAKARELRRVITIARTCLQDAQPASLGEFFSGHGVALERRTEELARSTEKLRRVNLGGTVIGSGSGAPPAYRRAILRRLREVTGLDLIARKNLYDAAQNIDDLGAVAATLGMLAEVLIKIAQDLRLLSSGPDGGFGEISLPAVQEGSSFFPGKINPVVPETLLQCCFQVLGHERAARLALERGELNLNVFEGAAAINLLDAIAILSRAVTLFTSRCVVGIAANQDRCRALAAQSRFKA
ncbi:MAG: lyase family protein [Candidatus Binataceae bacterium]